ncbi:MAG: ATP-dependent metallopeptidase FtsH/Yme1/Tma family protein, partial [Patescibacteria group bacterium]
MDNSKKTFRSPNRGGNGRRSFRGVGFIALLVLFGLIIFAAYGQSGSVKTVSTTEAIKDANKGQYSKIEVKGNELLITKRGDDQPTLKSSKDPQSSMKEEGFDLSKVEISYKPGSSTSSMLANIGFSLLPVIIICLVLFFMLRSAQGQGNQALSFGKSRARLYGNEKDKIVFKDIAGSEEAKQDLEEVVEFLKFPKKF